jgi:glyceraldehyde 3-phosphate dehydrogenase
MKETKMLRVGINGVGRIGKAIFRVNQDHPAFEVVALNDINPDPANLAYQLNYDSLYGRMPTLLRADGQYLQNGSNAIRVFHCQHIDEVPWGACDVDLVIDASGVYENVVHAPEVRKRQGVSKVVITHAPKEVDYTLVLGVNEDGYDPACHHIISSSICDAVAMAPVLNIIQEHYGINHGYITTLHPWLNYQNLSDGPASSWSVPGEIYHHYALGRAASASMIPKPTSAVEATCAVVPGLTTQRIGSFSYRTPLPIVGSADITLGLSRSIERESVVALFQQAEHEQMWKIIHNNVEPLVSQDFKQSPYSAIVDHRWTDLVAGSMLKIVLWYDNEWGYSSRVRDVVDYIATREK